MISDKISDLSSASSTSGRKDSVFVSAKRRIIETVSILSSVGSTYRWFSPICLVLFLIEICLLPFDSKYNNNPILSNIFRFLGLISNPVSLIYFFGQQTQFYLTWIFIFASTLVVAIISCFLFTIVYRVSQGFKMILLVLAKLLTTCGYIPIMRIFLVFMRISLSDGVIRELNVSFSEFPFSLFFVFSILLLVILTLFTIGFTLFFPDVLVSKKIISASSNGRMRSMEVFFTFLVMFLLDIFANNGALRVIAMIFGFIVSLTHIMLIVRITFFTGRKKLMNFLYVGAYSVSATGFLLGFVNSLTSSFFGLISLSVLPFLLILSFSALVIKYYVVLTNKDPDLLKKKNFVFKILFYSLTNDVVFHYNIHKDESIFTAFMEEKPKNQMIKLCYIQEVLEDNSFGATSMIKKLKASDFVPQMLNLDIIVFLRVYSKKIEELNIFNKSEDSKILKLARSMNTQEKKLSFSLTTLFQNILQNGETISIGKFPAILSDISDYYERIEEFYQKATVRNQKSSLLFRKYGEFLRNFSQKHEGERMIEYACELELSDTLEREKDKKVWVKQAKLGKNKEEGETKIEEFITCNLSTVSSKSSVSFSEDTKTISDNRKTSVKYSYGKHSEHSIASSGKDISKMYIFEKKVQNEKNSYVSCLRFFCVLMIFYVVICTIGSLLMFIIGESLFLGYSERVKMTSQLTGGVADVRKGFFQMVNSVDDRLELLGDIPIEKNFSFYWEETDYHIQKLEQDLAVFYFDLMDTQTKNFVDNTYVEFIHTIQKLNNSHVHIDSLIDGINIFINRAKTILEKNKDDFKYILDDNDYTYINLVEKSLHEGIDSVVGSIRNSQTLMLTIFTALNISFPVGGLLFFVPVFISFYFILRKALLKRISRLMLIPTEEIQKNYTKFKKRTKNVKFIMSRLNVLDKFLFSILIVVTVFTISLSVLAAVSVLQLNTFISSNAQVVESHKTKVACNRIDLLIRELMFSNISLYSKEVLESDLHEQIEIAKNSYNQIRFGNESIGLPESDKNPVLRNLIYNNAENCSAEDNSSRRSELNCKSFNWLMNLFLQNAHMVELFHEDFEQVVFIQNWYSDFTRMMYREDSLLNLEEFSTVVSEGNDNVLGVFSQKMDFFVGFFFSVDTNTTKTLYITTMVISFPILLVSILLIKNFPTKIHNTFTRVNKIILNFVDQKVVCSKTIYNAVVGGSVNFGKNKMRNITCERMKIFDHAVDGYILFLKDTLNVLYFNREAKKYFNIRDELNDLYFSSFLTQAGTIRVTEYLEKVIEKEAFSEELVGVNGKKEFPIQLNLSYSKGKIVAHIKNLEEEKVRLNIIEKEYKLRNVDKLIKNVIPSAIVDDLTLDKNCDIFKELGADFGLGEFNECTCFFGDVSNFTFICSKMTPKEVIHMVNRFVSEIDDICEEMKLEKIKTIGDCYFAVSGLPLYNPKHAHIAIEFALAVQKSLKQLNDDEGYNLHMKIGLSSGNCIAGLVGKSKIIYDVFSDTVNSAARMQTLGIVDKIQVSKSTYDHVWDKYSFMERVLTVKGKGVMKVYILKGNKKKISKKK